MNQASILVVAAAMGALATAVQAQTPSAPAAAAAAAASASGPHLLKLTNSGHGGITAIYVAPAGSLDMSDDLLGKQTAAPGKTVSLKIADPKATCVFDLQFLMNDGSTALRKGVNVCQTSDYTFTP
jgi:hypothetical protein